jgi:hypothetical protein
MFRFLSFCVLILFLAACSLPELAGQGRYVPPSRPGGRMCILQCRKALDRCRESCSLKKRSCFVVMQTQALRDYEQYMREQFMGGYPMDLHASDFERPEKCEDGCLGGCEEPYNLCYTRCGGEVSGRPLLPQTSF